jgi:TfoX/Sxy family transcriptional regulator of competence genes
MASDPSFVDYVCEQADCGDALTQRKMFGEYALYIDGKVVALVCDNQLFVKPTEAGRQLLGRVIEAPPYKGAKPSFLIHAELDDRALMRSLLLATAHALPAPKPKLKKTAIKASNPKI